MTRVLAFDQIDCFLDLRPIRNFKFVPGLSEKRQGGALLFG